MRPLTTGELGRMVGVATGQMLDACRILAHVEGSKDSYNRPTESYGSPGAEIVCTLLTQTPNEYQPTGQQTPQAAVRLRVPLGTVIESRDRVQVTKRFGRSVTPITYRVTGQPIPMVDALEAELEAV